MNLHAIFQANIREDIWESNKNIFPNRDVISFSFGIDLNITYLTQGINSNILECTMLQNYYIFSPLPQVPL